MSDLIAKFRYWLWGDGQTKRDDLVDQFNRVADDLSERVSVLKKLTDRLNKGAGQ